MKFNDSAYKGLINISKQNSEMFKSINTEAINMMQSSSVIQAQKGLSNVKELLIAQQDKETFSEVARLGVSMAEASDKYQIFFKEYRDITEKYNRLFNSYDFSRFSGNMSQQLAQSQLNTIAQLCSSYETQMIHDVIGCFANAEYKYLPNVINAAINKERIEAVDMAFVRTSDIISVIKSELNYPVGFASALKNLNLTTAQDISKKSSIKFDTKKNEFVNGDSAVNVKSMNIIYAGISFLGTDEVFSDKELIDFISVLSDRPMVAMNNDTGLKIFEWLKELNNNNTNIINFDCDIYYHCRSRKKDDMLYTFDEMVKPPHGIPSAGRFNHSGRSSFYFSDNRYGAEVEVRKHLSKDGKEVPQTVKLKPKKDIRLLDFSETLRRGESFLRMIRYPVKGNVINKMPKEYLLPNFVADCCKEIGIEGIKYYGSKKYSNYVCWEDGYFKDAGMCQYKKWKKLTT